MEATVVSERSTPLLLLVEFEAFLMSNFLVLFTSLLSSVNTMSFWITLLSTIVLFAFSVLISIEFSLTIESFILFKGTFNIAFPMVNISANKAATPTSLNQRGITFRSSFSFSFACILFQTSGEGLASKFLNRSLNNSSMFLFFFINP